MDNFEHCAALVREADRDRYLATLFAPADRRDALFALYAFNAELARGRGGAREPLPGEIRLQWWREVLNGERDGEAAAHPVAAAVRGTRGRYRFCAAAVRDGLRALGLGPCHALAPAVAVVARGARPQPDFQIIRHSGTARPGLRSL